MTARQIVQTLRAHSADLERFGVVRIGLYGSAARGKTRRDSDLDFLVALKRSSFDDYMDLKFFLEDLLDRKVDLVEDKALRPELAHVRSEAVYV
jgi:hypothetical protein